VGGALATGSDSRKGPLTNQNCHPSIRSKVLPIYRLDAARADPTALPAEDSKLGSLGPVGRVSRATRIRWGLRMSQIELAKTFYIPLRTLRDWEQYRRDPDQAVQAYFEVIAREPDAVRRALKPRATNAV